MNAQPVLTEAALASRMTYDICQCSAATRVRTAMGLSAVSEEVHAAEHAASHARLAAVAALAPAIEAMAHAATAALVVSARSTVCVHGPQEVKDAFVAGYATLIEVHLGPTIAAAVANLVDCHYLSPPGGTA